MTRFEDFIRRVAVGPRASRDLSRGEARDALDAILTGQVSEVRAAVLLIALRMKRESADENRGMLDALRAHARVVTAPVDRVLDLADPYNGYTRTPHLAPFVAALLASRGIPTVVHGGAGIPPKRGCTHRRVLEVLGADVTGTVETVAERLSTIGWGYVDIEQHSPALFGLRSLREAIVKRPSLSALEKLILPIRGRVETRLVVGHVHQGYDEALHELVGEEDSHALRVVRGIEGHVDLKTVSVTEGLQRNPEGVREPLSLDPAAAGIAPLRWDPALQVTPQEVANLGVQALLNEGGPATEQIVWTAGSLLQWMGSVSTSHEGVEMAREALRDGSALAHLQSGLVSEVS